MGMLAAGCSSGSSSSSGPPGSSPAATSSSAGTTVSTSQCGAKPGVKATGTPIPLGGIVTNQPGTSFTDIANMASAYFASVNDNGGINGHPIKYYIATEQTNPAQIAAAAHVPIVQTTENVPISDANSVAIKEVNDAGPNGAVVLNFTPPEALVILQAAQKLGLENRVRLWGCSTPCDTDFLASALGPKWNNKLFVNAEMTPATTTNTSTIKLYKAILQQSGKPA